MHDLFVNSFKQVSIETAMWQIPWYGDTPLIQRILSSSDNKVLWELGAVGTNTIFTDQWEMGEPRS